MSIPNSLCIIVPAFNEADTIVACLHSLRAAFPAATLLVVDNASTDHTGTKARRVYDAIVLDEPQPGKGSAVSAGVAWALQRGFDWLALHDADGEYSATGLRDLVDASQVHRASFRPASPGVMGVGLREVGLGQVLWRSLLANWLARRALQLSLKKTPPLDILTGARVFDADGAQRLFQDAAPMKGFELETALTRRALQAGLLLAYRPVRYAPRSAANKKIRAWDIFPILKAAWRA